MQTRVQFTHIPSWGGGLKPAEESFISAISNLQNRAQNQWFKHTHSFFKYTNWAATKFPQGEPQTKDQSLSPLPSYSRISFFLFLSPFTNQNQSHYRRQSFYFYPSFASNNPQPPPPQVPIFNTTLHDTTFTAPRASSKVTLSSIWFFFPSLPNLATTSKTKHSPETSQKPNRSQPKKQRIPESTGSREREPNQSQRKRAKWSWESAQTTTHSTSRARNWSKRCNRKRPRIQT